MKCEDNNPQFNDAQLVYRRSCPAFVEEVWITPHDDIFSTGYPKPIFSAFDKAFITYRVGTHINTAINYALGIVNNTDYGINTAQFEFNQQRITIRKGDTFEELLKLFNDKNK